MISQHTFPTSHASLLKVGLWLLKYARKFYWRKAKWDMGSLDTPAFWWVKAIAQVFTIWNINHLGNWSGSKDRPWASQWLERNVIAEMADLYGETLRTVGGYVTSGGSESNLFLLWLGREKLRKKRVKKTVLFQTSLTHYSVTKAARILDIEIDSVALDEDSWSMSVAGLKKKIQSYYKKGYRGFYLPLTIGYSTTGTIDDWEKMNNLALDLQKKYKDIHFYGWLDAALNGLIEPFLRKDFYPFKASLIQGIVVDFHKFGGLSPTGSVALYRQGLRSGIEEPIHYLKNSDATLLGGRSGIPAILIWVVIQVLGREGFQKRVFNCLKVKAYFLSQLQELGISYVTHERSITVGVLRSPKQRFSSEIESDFSLYFSHLKLFFSSNAHQNVYLYKMFVLPHVTFKTVDDLITRIKKS